MNEAMMAPGEALLVAARGEDLDSGLHRYVLNGGAWCGGLIAPAPGLASLAWHPSLPVVYAVAGTGERRLLAWRIDGQGATALANGHSGGVEPCALAVAPTGRALVVTNYASGTLALQRLTPDGAFDGVPETLDPEGNGPDPERQEAAHPHHAVFDGAHLRVVGLGAELLRSYAADLSEGFVALGEEALPPGSGPRHCVALPDGRLAITGEVAATLLVGRPGSGDWTSVPGSRRKGPAHTRSPRNYPGDLQAGASGGHLYFANRGHDSIATFDLSDAAAAPRMVDERDAGVAWPQHLLMHRSHLFIAGWDSGQVVAMPLGTPLAAGMAPATRPEKRCVPGAARRLFDCRGACWLLLHQPL